MRRGPKQYWNSLVRTVFPRLALHEVDGPQKFIGREVMARRELDGSDEKITVEDIRGCAGIVTDVKMRERLVKHYQINGTHYCHMFSFHTQMDEGRVPTDEELAEFELATQITKIKRTDNKDKKGKHGKTKKN